MKVITGLLTLLLYCGIGRANQVYVKRDSLPKLKYEIGITPSALLNVYRGVQVYQKLNFGNNMSVQLESGYIFHSAYFDDKYVSGFRLRPSLVLPIHITSSIKYEWNVFLQYRYINFERESEQIRGNGAYTELTKSTRLNQFYGGGLGISMSEKIQSINYRVGLGMGLGKMTNKYDPNDDAFNDFFLFNEEEAVVPILILNVGVGI